jgi:N-acetylmuramoyl-L-alanine amidase
MALVVLDAGHGGYDPGATANGLLEKDLTLDLVLRVEDLLAVKGHTILVTRQSDVFVGLSARADYANSVGADYFVSFHHNAGGGTGFESYVYPGSRENVTGQKQDIVHSAIMTFLANYGLRDRGKKEANFAVLRETQMSAILLENLFVDTASDAALLKDPVFLNGLANSISSGIHSAVS